MRNLDRDRSTHSESDWDGMITSRQLRVSDASRRKRIYREMWTELGFTWADCGILGDVCFDMVLKLSEAERAVFDAELERRLGEADDTARTDDRGRVKESRDDDN